MGVGTRHPLSRRRPLRRSSTSAPLCTKPQWWVGADGAEEAEEAEGAEEEVAVCRMRASRSRLPGLWEEGRRMHSNTTRSQAAAAVVSASAV